MGGGGGEGGSSSSLKSWPDNGQVCVCARARSCTVTYFGLRHWLQSLGRRGLKLALAVTLFASVSTAPSLGH